MKIYVLPLKLKKTDGAVDVNVYEAGVDGQAREVEHARSCVGDLPESGDATVFDKKVFAFDYRVGGDEAGAAEEEFVGLFVGHGGSG